MKSKAIVYSISVLSISLVLMAAITENSDEWSIPKEYSEMKNTRKSDKKGLAIGKELYGKICATCHGDEGKGDGPKAKKLKKPLVDCTAKKYLDANKDGELYYKVFIGRNSHNFEKKIGDKNDCWQVINYMRSLSH